MPRNFRREDRNQNMLFPPSLEEWVPEGHLSRIIRETVLRLDEEGRLQPFYESYREDGRGGGAYHVVTMLSLLLYSYCLGITSSRKIARGIEDSFPFRYLAANQLVDFRTISSFRKRHLVAFLALFTEVLRLCSAAGLVKLGRVALDGRKVKANASRDQSLTAETIEQQIKELAQEILEEAQKIDEEEDAEHGAERGDELPPGFRTKEERLARLEEAREVLKERERKILDEYEAKLEARKRFEEETGEKKRGPGPKPPDASKTKKKKPPKANTTDPESRLMKVRQGFIQGYNAQAAVDCDSQVIVGQDVTQDVVDTFQLEPMLELVEAETGELPDQCVVDAGYWSPENADLEEETGVELFIATQKDSKQRTAHKRQKAPRGRIPKNASSRQRMERKLLTKRGKNVYRCRGPSVEGVFGQQVGRGLTTFLLRGLEAVRGEWALWTLTHNLLKLFRAQGAAL
jgi:transposase